MDHWVLEQSEIYGMSLFDNIPSEEVDPAIRRLRQEPVGFKSEDIDLEGIDMVTVVDESPDDITVATYDQNNGGAYRVRPVKVDDIPEDIIDEIPSSMLDIFPFRRQEAYELTVAQIEDHDYNLDKLSGDRIDEAQRATNEAKELLNSDNYDNRAWGYKSKFGI